MKSFLNFFSSLAEEISADNKPTIAIQSEAIKNSNFRKVLYTGKHFQVVVMSISANDDIGEETHNEGDQFIRIESGQCLFFLDGIEYDVSSGECVLIPQGIKHNILNVNNVPLKLSVIYSWPNHKDGHIDVFKPVE